MPGLLRRCLDGGAPAQNDHVGERDLLPAGLRAVEILLDFLESRQNLRELGRLVDFPILLRRQANARPVRATAFVGAAERGRRSPGGCHQLRNGQSGCEDLGLEAERCPAPRSIHDRRRGQGLATTAAREPAGRGTARRAPYRGASACTTPWQRLRRTASGFSWKRFEIGA